MVTKTQNYTKQKREHEGSHDGSLVAPDFSLVPFFSRSKLGYGPAPFFLSAHNPLALFLLEGGNTGKNTDKEGTTWEGASTIRRIM